MKIYNKIIGLFAVALLFTACDPEVGDKPGIGNAPSVDDIHFTMAPTAADPNNIQFDFTSDLISPYWAFKKMDGSVMSTNKRSFALKYIWGGEHDGSIQAYGRGGLSEAKTFKVSVAANDPIIALLTGKTTPKVWVWDSSVQGHLGCGEPTATTPNWWSAGPNELAGKGIYDDELTFLLDGNKRNYVLSAHGDIFVNETAATTMAPDLFTKQPDAAVTVPYTQPVGQTWFMDLDADGNLYLTFTGKGFPSYVANPNALDGRYEILELTETTLQLQWKGSGINWYMRFKAKQ